MTPRILVAGVGNVFLTDDGFGPEAARRLAVESLPAGVSVVDYGIRGMHLAYDLLAGYDTLILLDALPRGGAAGDVTVLEVGEEDLPGARAGDGASAPIGGGADQAPARPVAFDAHGMDPAAVLASLGALGGRLPRTFVVGCEPGDVGEGIGLTPQVAAAMDRALSAIRVLVGAQPVGHTDNAKGV